MTMITTTLIDIREAQPCATGWTKLLKHLGKSQADSEPLPLLTVLDSNGLDDTLWVLDETSCNPRLARHFSARCAMRVLPIFEREYPDDKRPRRAIEVALDDNATEEQLSAAGAAAWNARAATRDATRAATRAAARAAAWNAAWGARAAWNDEVAFQTEELRKMLTEGF